MKESIKELLAILNKHSKELKLSNAEISQKNKAYKLLKEI